MFSSGLEWVRSRAPAGFDHTQWHNYAMTYDIATGDRTFYMDGASVGGDNILYAAGASWIDCSVSWAVASTDGRAAIVGPLGSSSATSAARGSLVRRERAR